MRRAIMVSTVLVSTALAASLVRQADAAGWGVNQIQAPTGAYDFGESVAVSRDGNTALVAAPYEGCAAGGGCGAAYVYVRDGKGWRLQARLAASDAAADMNFGGDQWDDNTVALSANGNVAFIGINPGPSYAPSTGAVYVFVRDHGAWQQQQKLVRPDASDTGTDGFGRSVASSDDGGTVVIGDGPWRYNFGFGPEGSAYVFTRVKGQWSADAHLMGSRTEHGDGNRVSGFGRSVGISGDGHTVVVGSPGSPTDLLEAYVFTKVDHKGWQEQAILTPADKGAVDSYGSPVTSFGTSVAMSQSGGTVVVGGDYGAAYIFQQHGPRGDWEEEAKIGSTIASKPRFAFSVDIDAAGQNAVVGDWAAGTAFLFHRTSDPRQGVQWVPQEVLAQSGGVGSSVAISGDANTIVVGYGVYVLDSRPQIGKQDVD